MDPIEELIISRYKTMSIQAKINAMILIDLGYSDKGKLAVNAPIIKWQDKMIKDSCFEVISMDEETINKHIDWPLGVTIIKVSHTPAYQHFKMKSIHYRAWFLPVSQPKLRIKSGDYRDGSFSVNRWHCDKTGYVYVFCYPHTVSSSDHQMETDDVNDE